MTTPPAWRLDDRVREGARIGFYDVEQRLGSGGLAVVYRARDVKLDRRVALKFLGDTYAADAGVRERFLHEARAMARLHHSSIVGVHAFDELEERPYFAMELVEGGTLADRLTPDLEIHEVLAIALQVVDAIEHAWKSLQLVHRDIKPANILLTRDGRAKLADFGLAKVLASGVKSTVTQTGTVMGTPYYLSPEQIRGQDLDHRSDFYSLGATLYHCLTGAAPFDGDAAMAIVVKHLEEVPVPPRERRPGLDPAVDDLVVRLLAKKRDQRPADHATLRAEILECLGDRAPAVTNPMSKSGPRVTAKKIPLAETMVQKVPPPTPAGVAAPAPALEPAPDPAPAPEVAAAGAQVSLRPWRWVALVATMVLVAAMVSLRTQRRQDRLERREERVTHRSAASAALEPPPTPAASLRPEPPQVTGAPAKRAMLSLLPEGPTKDELVRERNQYLKDNTPAGFRLSEWQMTLLGPTEAQRRALLALADGADGPEHLARARLRFQLWVVDRYLAKLPQLEVDSTPAVRLASQLHELVHGLAARLRNPWAIRAGQEQRDRIQDRMEALLRQDFQDTEGMRQSLRELIRVLGPSGGTDLLESDSELARLVPLP